MYDARYVMYDVFPYMIEAVTGCVRRNVAGYTM